MTSHLTTEEIEAIQSLHQRTPYLIPGVSRSQFSIARRYGGTTYNREAYTYIPPTDELIRDDVLRFVTRLRRSKRQAAATPSLLEQS